MAERYTNASQLRHRKERSTQLVVSGGNASVALELAEEPLDGISLLVKPQTEDNGSFSEGCLPRTVLAVAWPAANQHHKHCQRAAYPQEQGREQFVGCR